MNKYVYKCPNCQYDLNQIHTFKNMLADTEEEWLKLKKPFEKRANRKFTKQGLINHYNDKHRNSMELRRCSCGKILTWDEDCFCNKCQIKVDNEELKMMIEEINLADEAMEIAELEEDYEPEP